MKAFTQNILKYFALAGTAVLAYTLFTWLRISFLRISIWGYNMTALFLAAAVTFATSRFCFAK